MEEPRSSGTQIDLVRRYARMLRRESAQYRGPHIGARERREARERAARAALGTVPREPDPAGPPPAAA
jgi:hypothetical protein